MIQKIVNRVSKSDALMIFYFTLEIGFFIFTGMFLILLCLSPSLNLIFVSILSFAIGLLDAFMVGESIRIKERRKING